MNKNLIIVFIALLFAGNLFCQGSYWEDLPSPPGGIQRVIQTSKQDTLYAPGLFRSTDLGMSWQHIEVSLFPSDHRVDIGNQGTFFYPTDNSSSPNHVYKSVNEGASWQLFRDSVSQNYQILETSTGKLIEYDYSGDSSWIALSTDGGQNWSNLWIVPGFHSAYLSLYEFPNQQLVIGADHNLSFYSNDGGENWTTVSPSIKYYQNIIASSVGTLFLYGDAGHYFISTDRGLNWEKILLNDKNIQLANITSMLAFPSGRILCSGASAKDIYFSDDDGLSWQAQSSNRFINLEAVLSNGDLLGKGTILYRSSDGGQNWEPSNAGTSSSGTYELKIANSDIQFFSNNGYWKLENGNLTELHPNSHKMAVGEQQILLAYNKSIHSENYGLFWSNDWGNTLTNVEVPEHESSIDYLAISPGDSLWFMDNDGTLYRSADQGLSWQNTGIEHVAQIVFHPSGRYFAITNYWYSEYFISDDFGKSWQLQTNIPAWFEIVAISIGPSNTIFLVSHEDAHLARSTDLGVSWQFSNLPYPKDFNHPGLSLQENSVGHFFAGIDYNSKIVLSTDQGVSWQSIPNYPNSLIYSLLLSPDQRLYIAHIDGLARTASPTTQGAYLRGHVNKDGDADCSTPDAQEPLGNWAVAAEGNFNYYATTNIDGAYQFFIDTGAYAVSVQVPQQLWWTLCDTMQTIVLDSVQGIDTLDFAALALSECPLITVDLTIPRLRRCFDNTVYVNYCNQGSEPADSAWVDIELDPYLSLVSSAQPNTPLGNNTFRFAVGNIIPGQCGSFTLTVHVDCVTVPGQTHCITAHGYPDTLCVPVPAWSGAEIQASVTCQDTVVHFELQNIGPAPSQLLEYIIIEDDVVLMNGQEDYNPGEMVTFDLPANGHTWRLESEQEPGHPFTTPNHIALAFAEGCAGFESLGFINQFPVDQFTPSWDQDCLENTGSYDPNDKQGFPTGYSAEHRIRPGQELEYLIRFQNTGTDTAFTVIIRDTLSPWLDPASVRPGASSHDYTWNLSGQGVLAFTFKNILLPDSNVNEAASHGFISFRIEQHPNVPLEAVIYNEANIYFDFNAPVITNETWHTVGELQTVGLSAVPKPIVSSEISVNPQPASTFAVFQRTDGKAFRNHRLYLFDALGRIIRQEVLNGTQYRQERLGMEAGLYFYKIEAENGQVLGMGRVLFQ